MVSKSDLTIIGMLELLIIRRRRFIVIVGVIKMNEHEFLFVLIFLEPFQSMRCGFVAGSLHNILSFTGFVIESVIINIKSLIQSKTLIENLCADNAVCGVPFFLYLLKREKGEYGL